MRRGQGGTESKGKRCGHHLDARLVAGAQEEGRALREELHVLHAKVLDVLQHQLLPHVVAGVRGGDSGVVQLRAKGG